MYYYFLKNEEAEPRLNNNENKAGRIISII
jgi:hypothetical protein